MESIRSHKHPILLEFGLARPFVVSKSSRRERKNRLAKIIKSGRSGDNGNVNERDIGWAPSSRNRKGLKVID
jgi:hypothetical protein